MSEPVENVCSLLRLAYGPCGDQNTHPRERELILHALLLMTLPRLRVHMGTSMGIRTPT